jgi:uncharacterized protein YjbI with pentapeptide repeats
MGNADLTDGRPGQPWAIDTPTTMQYTGDVPGRIQMLSSGWAHMTLAGNVPSQPDTSRSLAWLSMFAYFPLVVHVVVPSLAAMRSAGGAPGADFTNVRLGGADLSGLNLSGAIFTGASLSQANLTGTILSANANLANQDLRSCTLSKTNFSGSNLQGVTLAGKVVDPLTNLSGANLQGAHLAGATLAGVNLSGADLRRADLNGTNLTGADLAGTDFSGLDVRNVIFGPNPKFSTDPKNLTKFTGSTLPFSLIGLNWSYLNLVGTTIVGIPVDGNGRLQLPGLQAVAANLSGRLFSDANLKSAGGSVTNFSGATLVGANFSGADCSGANFTGATLGGGPGQGAAVMSTATLFNAVFNDAQLSGVNFAGAYLYGASASVSGATMPGVDFANAYLTGLNLSNVRNANMAGAVFDGACCVNCNFTGTTVMPDSSGRGGSFVAACLQGANFTDASLGGSDLVNAGIAPPCPTPGTCKFPATLKIAGSPVTIQINVNSAGTLLPPSATNGASVCPDKSNGPCAGSHLYAPGAPKAWPVTGGVGGGPTGRVGDAASGAP